MAETNNLTFTQEQLVRQKNRTVYDESKKDYSEITKSSTFQSELMNTEITLLKNESVTKQNVSITIAVFGSYNSTNDWHSKNLENMTFMAHYSVE